MKTIILLIVLTAFVQGCARRHTITTLPRAGAIAIAVGCNSGSDCNGFKDGWRR